MNLLRVNNKLHEPMTSALRGHIKEKEMGFQKATLLHVLAADPPMNGRVRARATVRTGAPKVGDRLWFAGGDRVRRSLTIVSMEHSPRWWTIEFLGPEEDVRRVVTGTYLQGGDS